MADDPPDRYHNREEDSPESLRRSLDDLAGAVAALDRKLDDVAMRLDADIDGARAMTRRLAGDVAQMGDALVRRIDRTATTLPIRVSAEPRRSRGAPWIAGLVLLLAAAAAAILLRPTTSGLRSAAAPRVAPAVVPRPEPAPTPAPQAISQPALTVPPEIRRHSGSTATHKWRPHHHWRSPTVAAPTDLPAAPPSGVF